MFLIRMNCKDRSWWMQEDGWTAAPDADGVMSFGDRMAAEAALSCTLSSAKNGYTGETLACEIVRQEDALLP